MHVIEGQLIAPKGKIALIASRFNELVVKELIAGAQDCLLRHGVKTTDITLIRVAGAYEIAHAASLVAKSKQYAGIVALGCIIRGETAHFDYVASASNSGLMQVSITHDIALGFGVLTVESLDQALARAGSKAGNKGAEAALAVIEQINMQAALQSHLAGS
jgi:6,7-dimethyl-8-ribityllumazine synthase